MAARTRRTSSRSRTSRQSTSGQLWQSLQLPPHVARSLFGLVLIVVGAVTLIALLFPTAVLNRYVADALLPLFGQGAWLLAILLIVAGVAVERPGTLGYGSSLTIVGGLVVFVAGLGLIHLVWGRGSGDAALRDGGGALGNALSSGLSDLMSPIGAFVVLLGLLVGGVLLLFNITLRTLLTPVAGGGRILAKAMATPARALAEGASARRAEAAANGRSALAEPPTKTRLREGKPERAPREAPLKPVPTAPESQTAAPLSQTIWSAQLGGTSSAAGEPLARITDAGDEPAIPARSWTMPAFDLLDTEGTIAAPGARLDHARNIRIIEEKLSSFQIPAAVVATNSGPVVTQYEVKPDATVKLSRIEALADDLAMALAARSIRIEAPIPGRDVVGIEIPNHNSEIVGFKRLLEDAGMTDATSKLTFALGRDVSGKAYAVDLARMPHLLIAGATGSGKSVCVNALIGSLLMRATPDEVRLILVDLKRVELAAYRDLPHLETPVIVESHEARAVLTNLVHEMEHRYELLAEAMERNLAAFNVSPRRIGNAMPYMVVVIDELADLILREGRKVEDPIVKLAQKARAVGIHLVLATQRPSVNVVTGLIKANVPSRIAFAMASNVDSRTVLDANGAEDLIGRGDMLYQPADLPRPVRLQGVFVSDPEIRAVTDFWRAQAEPTYNRDLLSGAELEDGGESGQFAFLAKGTGDELVPRAAELVMQTGRASTSMLQTKLKVGFNRATRIIDELEKHGIIGPLDTRNPGAPRTVYGPENWIRDAAEANSELN
ncbi:MAG: segregation ATPase FtsK/SpoIIIE, family [Chloroflexota bacterium]|jgi:S-DNA-T family DNA segregation ATPase FtsK/SpoIIIE|nr:segregation ATPase FtsK/SpoIIIE, family [Chloroflexota bacterium]